MTPIKMAAECLYKNTPGTLESYPKALKRRDGPGCRWRTPPTPRRQPKLNAQAWVVWYNEDAGCVRLNWWRDGLGKLELTVHQDEVGVAAEWLAAFIASGGAGQPTSPPETRWAGDRPWGDFPFPIEERFRRNPWYVWSQKGWDAIEKRRRTQA